LSAPKPSLASRDVWRLLLLAARPHARQFITVAVLAMLATGIGLLEPLIYRAAINDISGLFVGTPGSRGVDLIVAQNAAKGHPSGTAAPAAPGREPSQDQAHQRSHARGHVAERTPSQTLRTLLWAATLLFLINVLSHWFSLTADQRTAELASRLEADVIQRTFGHVLALPLTFFSRRSSGGLAKQIDQSDQVAPIVTAIAQDVVPEVMTMVGAFTIMMTQSSRLTLISLVTLPPYLWVVRKSVKRLDTGLTQYWEMWEAVSARIQDALGAIKTVKLSGAERREASQLRADSEAAYGTYVQRNRLANRYEFWQESLGYLGQALVLGYGGLLVLEHQLTPGDVVMFVAYLDRLYAPIETLTSLGVTLQENLASLRRAVRLLQTPGGEVGGVPLAKGPGRVEFQGVHFGYTPGHEVLRGLSFEIAPGSVTALVGPSGAGKTTTVDLLLRLFEPASGEIRVDGQSLASLDPASLRSEIAVVAADGAVFRGSIASNIRYKRPDATDAEVLAAAAAAGLAPMLARLPQGLETQVGEGGVGLSVGERQRLQIARALAGRPRILVLDEATANLDYSTESEIRSALLQSADRPTTLVIAHRYSMVENADHVLVLDGGRVLESGTVQALVNGGGWFARFAASAKGHALSEGDEDATEGDDEQEEQGDEDATEDEPEDEG
jgi:ATP-binding cassette subfamily B protein